MSCDKCFKSGSYLTKDLHFVDCDCGAKKREVFIFSDPHFGHSNILKFKDSKGNKYREQFETIEEMDNTLIDNLKIVNDYPGALLYCLGDVFIGQCDDIIKRFHTEIRASKRLILGNHDSGKDQRLPKLFKKITLWKRFKEYKVVLSHFPLHESTIPDGFFNIHGHIHANISPSTRHINACVEKTNMKPMTIPQLVNRHLNEMGVVR